MWTELVAKMAVGIAVGITVQKIVMNILIYLVEKWDNR